MPRDPIPSELEAAALRIVIRYLRKCERNRRDSGGRRCIPTLENKLALVKTSKETSDGTARI